MSKGAQVSIGANVPIRRINFSVKEGELTGGVVHNVPEGGCDFPIGADRKKCSVSLLTDTVADVHAVLRVSKDRKTAMLIDHGGETRVNRKLVVGRVPVSDGDVITVGRAEIGLEFYPQSLARS